MRAFGRLLLGPRQTLQRRRGVSRKRPILRLLGQIFLNQVPVTGFHQSHGMRLSEYQRRPAPVVKQSEIFLIAAKCQQRVRPFFIIKMQISLLARTILSQYKYINF